MKNNAIHIVLVSFFALLFTSCNTHKKLVYFQDEINSTSEDNASNYTPIFKADDLISILITGDDPEVTIPFNLDPSGSPQALNNGYSTGNIERVGYLIDKDGNINMPIIGMLQVKGLSRNEAISMIQEKMSEYISNPIVNIQILNFKVSVLGDVNRPGTYKIPNERITLLEAIGLSGDLNITGNRKNILVIRDIDGKKEEFRIDLTASDLFRSKVYYLEQNDVVYVEPNNAARSNSTIWKTSGTIFISTVALIITTVNLLVK